MEDKAFQLDRSYEYTVKVLDGNNSFQGKLSMSPSHSTISITGEESPTRKCTFGSSDLKYLRCHSLNITFLLINLRFKSAYHTALNPRELDIAGFEWIFEVGYVLKTKSHISSDPKFHGINFISSSIQKWIGFTNKQNEIMHTLQGNDYEAKKNLNTLQFQTRMGDGGSILVEYPTRTFYNAPEQKAGFEYPPHFHFSNQNSLDPLQVVQKLHEILDLFFFLVGPHFRVEKIMVSSTSNNLSLYYCAKQAQPLEEREVIFYPLGRDKVYPELGFPEISDSLFNTYFNLESEKKFLFKKFLLYRKMESIEDRFLGHFRILESICKVEKTYFDESKLEPLLEISVGYFSKRINGKVSDVKKFFKSIMKLNRSKYNTAASIRLFMEEIPKDYLSGICFGNNDIDTICKLRNDITHANDYYEDEENLLKKAKFIECLSIFGLCKILGVSPEVTSKLISRVSGHFRIEIRR